MSVRAVAAGGALHPVVAAPGSPRRRPAARAAPAPARTGAAGRPARRRAARAAGRAGSAPSAGGCPARPPPPAGRRGGRARRRACRAGARGCARSGPRTARAGGATARRGPAGRRRRPARRARPRRARLPRRARRRPPAARARPSRRTSCQGCGSPTTTGRPPSRRARRSRWPGPSRSGSSSSAVPSASSSAASRARSSQRPASSRPARTGTSDGRQGRRRQPAGDPRGLLDLPLRRLRQQQPGQRAPAALPVAGERRLLGGEPLRAGGRQLVDVREHRPGQLHQVAGGQPGLAAPSAPVGPRRRGHRCGRRRAARRASGPTRASPAAELGVHLAAARGAPLVLARLLAGERQEAREGELHAPPHPAPNCPSSGRAYAGTSRAIAASTSSASEGSWSTSSATRRGGSVSDSGPVTAPPCQAPTRRRGAPPAEERPCGDGRGASGRRSCGRRRTRAAGVLPVRRGRRRTGTARTAAGAAA